MSPGSRIGPYEVTAPLGEGGMGVVYRARDTQLQRQVALKVLPDHFADDPDRLNRFEREAQVLASLNHPNIAQIYGLEKSGPTSCIVMELVEGETLAAQLNRGPLSLDEAVNVAKQIVEALEAAHERGIVHRDLKPANIKRTPSGAVKILDFGLAKASASPAPSDQGFSNSPTLVSGSMAGVILGTAPYMSPEQARGKTVDARTDIWAFGCVLYEMLTGRPAFTGETTTDILAKVLEGQPQWDALPAGIPPSIRMLLEAAFKKDAKQRLQHIGDARLFLGRPETLDRSMPAAVPQGRRRRGWFAVAALAMVLAAGLVPASLYFLRAPAELPVVRFEMPASGILNPPAGIPFISPDGQRIAYLGQNSSGKTVVWIRPLGSLAAQQLQGTENASGALFWAPDSHRLAFYVDNKLKKIDIAGGVVQTLCDVVLAVPGAWSKDGVILFGAIIAGGPTIARIPDSGGEPTPVIAADPSSNGIQFIPRLLPDGRHFLFHTVSNDGQTGSVYFAAFDSKTVTRIVGLSDFGPTGDNSQAEYSQGYLLFSRGRTLLAQPFDPARGTLSGEPVPIAQNVGRGFSVSETGVLVYRTLPAESGQPVTARLSWVDRKGKPVGEIASPAAAGNIRLFRDGRIVLDNIGAPGNPDLWVLDSRGVPNKVTSDNPNFDGYPVWSPDGSRIAFASIREQRLAESKLYLRESNGVGVAEPLLPGDAQDVDIPQDWSAAGIIFQRFKLASFQNIDLWSLSMPDKKPSLYLHNGFVNTQPQISPDGRYIAYATNESGSFQIVVQTFPDASGGKWPVTAQGGTEPAWKHDGRELYYLAPSGKMMAVAVKTDSTFQAGQTTELFQTALAPLPTPFPRRYAVSDDGQRFLIATAISAPALSGESTPITAVINWTARLRKK
jgi:eukaryotic-like serine/threonine-protein kinase